MWDAKLFAHGHALAPDFVRGYWDAAWAAQTGWGGLFCACDRLSLREANQLESAHVRDARRSLAFSNSLTQDVC